jgi:hypothetical protein
MLIGSYTWDHNKWERALINSSCKLSSIDSGFGRLISQHQKKMN